MATPRVENKWAPNNFATKLIENLYTETPRLLDRSNTPRGAARAITLDRNFSNKKWLYNKSTRDHFDPNQTKIELDRSKKLRRLTRKQEKQRDKFLTKRNMSVNDSMQKMSGHGPMYSSNAQSYNTEMKMMVSM